MKTFLIEAINDTATVTEIVTVKATDWVSDLAVAASSHLWASGFRVISKDGKPFSDVIHTR